MNPGSLRLRLTIQDPATGERREPVLTPPIALGREFASMPGEIQGRRVSRLLLDNGNVSRYHALIDWEQDQLVVIDQGSANGTLVNGVRQTRSVLANGNTLQIGPYQIAVSFVTSGSNSPAPNSPAPGNSFIHFNPNTGLPDPRINQRPPVQTPTGGGFPPPAFLQAQQVAVQALYATRLQVDETEYAAIGAGLGSYIWVDLLRIWGVQSSQIMALGLESKPYAHYKHLCLASQIPLHERLRSNSDSCPDNIWGWPSYAWREAWHDFLQGQLGTAFKYLWQVFAEPAFAETYTPRAGKVFDSIDREAKRIGWDQIYRYGSVRAIRKTNDERFGIAYSRGGGNYGILVARHVHLATGYPAIRFLEDLQEYRKKTGDLKSVVNAYEEHNHVYDHLGKYGGTVLIRGQGIVASRIIQRLYEVRQQTGKNISVLHLLRAAKAKGNKFGSAQRKVENHWEFQPFNWPKACWGGDLREMLEKAAPDQRQRLLADWGGTTTADRSDWRRMVQEGLAQGWYKIEFGKVARVEREAQNRTITYIEGKGFGEVKLPADFIIDATGLDAKVEANPLINDLATHYKLPLHNNGRLVVGNDFELTGMRNGQGRMYAAGAITLGGPLAAVDSFLGLQYSALCSVDSLAAAGARGVKRMNGLTSLGQWLKWVNNQSPC